MKALSLWEPWASLCVIAKDHLIRCDGCGAKWLDSTGGCECTCADGDDNYEDWVSFPIPVKWIETRPNATNIRGRIAIHATLRRPTWAEMKAVVADQPDAWNAWYRAGLVSRDGETDRMTYGAIVGHVDLYDCVPMVAHADVDNDTRPVLSVGGDRLTLWESGRPGWPYEQGTNCTDQLPFGNFAPGRFAWLFRHSVRLETPAPFKGGQGWSREWPGLSIGEPSEQLTAWAAMAAEEPNA